MLQVTQHTMTNNRNFQGTLKVMNMRGPAWTHLGHAICCHGYWIIKLLKFTFHHWCWKMSKQSKVF